MAARPGDNDDGGDGLGETSSTVIPIEAIEREGRETLLPSVTRSVLSKSVVNAGSGPDSGSGVDDSYDGRRRGGRTGDVIGGRYVVEGQLGRGGMGRVMRVRHQALGKAFALKLIKSRIALDPKIRELFYQEARLASSLTHDNICSIVDFGEDDHAGLFMVMELLDGQNLHQRLQTGRLSPRVACDVMWQVADALRFIHSRSILHGDVKSENIFLLRTTSLQRRLVKLLDFGLARPDLGRREGMDGTPEYTAPERIDGAPASPASDIYALGIVFYELLVGRIPFSGTLDEILRQHREVPVPAPSKQLGDPLDERADHLIARATSKDPALRHPDVPAFMYELRALMTMLGMDNVRRRAMATDAARERREVDQRQKAAAEVFAAVPVPMASCDARGRVRAANAAFLEFLGADGDGCGLELGESAFPDVYPQLLADIAEVALRRLPIKRVIYLAEGGGRVVEAAVLLSAAPATSEVTTGDVHLVVHPLLS